VENPGEASWTTRPAWAGVVDEEVRPMVMEAGTSGRDVRGRGIWLTTACIRN